MSCSHKILLRAPQARQLILGIGLSVLCCSVPLLGGYKSVKVKIDRASTYPSYHRQGKVVIAADPYLTKEKIVTAFDAKDLEKLGIVPVNIILTNEGEEGWFETTRRSIVRIYAALSLSFWPPGLCFWPSCVGASAGARFGGAAGLRARREVGTK